MVRRAAPMPLDILLPGLLMLVAWSLLRIGFDDPPAACVVAFLAALALRFALRAEDDTRKTRQAPSPRWLRGPIQRRANASSACISY
jgi:hypothetical protein